jgi:hypothetical protein
MDKYDLIVSLLLFLSNIPPRVIYAYIVQLNRKRGFSSNFTCALHGFGLELLAGMVILSLP